MALRDIKNISDRLGFIEKKAGVKLTEIKDLLIEKTEIKIENLIGVIKIPLGIAGPLLINHKKEQRSYYLPLATTEGGLTASINRGCKAVSLCGGAICESEKVGVTRGPVFYTGGIREGKKLMSWIQKNEELIAAVAEGTSSHLRYKKSEIKLVGSYGFLRIYFDSSEAMGMNMATIAVDKIVELIEEKIGFKCISIAGNYDNDKKPSWLNFINNRGIKTWAEVILTDKVIKEVLKTSAKDIFEVWLSKCMIGSAMSGSLGFNSQFANTVAALFIATGQDPAHTVEGSMGITTTKILEDGNLYFSVYIPSLMVGTIGGGTKYPTQKEALKILGVNNSLILAEVMAAGVLAGEISLLASLAEGSLAKAHEKLAR